MVITSMCCKFYVFLLQRNTINFTPRHSVNVRFTSKKVDLESMVTNKEFETENFLDLKYLK